MAWTEKLALGAALFCACATGALAGSVSGRVTDGRGAPLADVHVDVVYQTYRADQTMGYGLSIKKSAVTDSDGRYSISTDGLPPGEYAANAYMVELNSGREANVDLAAEDGSTFASNADTVRNFTGGIIERSDELPYGNAGVFVLNNAIGDFTDLSNAEVTLVHAESGKTYVNTVRSSGEGLVVTGIPFGTYRATVSLGGQRMQVALWGPGQSDGYAAEVVHDFTMGYLHNQLLVAARP
jgi:hypothetical protein